MPDNEWILQTSQGMPHQTWTTDVPGLAVLPNYLQTANAAASVQGASTPQASPGSAGTAASCLSTNLVPGSCCGGGRPCAATASVLALRYTPVYKITGTPSSGSYSTVPAAGCGTDEGSCVY
eukprot:GHUV01032632.1.p1 GENE.GHUV01032632.1~~GHUV01032632.1.p1  ORF type:complete len:122 (+),score=33.15 GHUV01032632.1:62-427(+)